MMDRRDDRSWPEWLEPLRPDDVTRRRVRSGIMRSAAPLLEARRQEAWWGLAAWTSRLVPVAAAAALFFMWLASSVAPSQTPVTVPTATAYDTVADSMELIVGPDAATPPSVLTSEQAPSPDAVLTAAVYEGS
ncbi:MAG: hypothetical protein ACOC83_00135 [Gemmatimonadota bacterium]